MKFLIVAIVLATVSPASAQSMFGNPPKVVTYTNKATGEIIGRAVISNGGRMIVLRNKHDEHYATIIQENGTRRWVDPSGNPIDPKVMTVPFD